MSNLFCDSGPTSKCLKYVATKFVFVFFTHPQTKVHSGAFKSIVTDCAIAWNDKRTDSSLPKHSMCTLHNVYAERVSNHQEFLKYIVHSRLDGVKNQLMSHRYKSNCEENTQQLDVSEFHWQSQLKLAKLLFWFNLLHSQSVCLTWKTVLSAGRQEICLFCWTVTRTHICFLCGNLKHYKWWPKAKATRNMSPLYL